MSNKRYNFDIHGEDERLRDAGIHKNSLRKAIRLLDELVEQLEANDLHIFVDGTGTACIWHSDYSVYDGQHNVIADIVGPFDGGDW